VTVYLRTVKLLSYYGVADAPCSASQRRRWFAFIPGAPVGNQIRTY
jgi:hypothetical protein